jgi:hypothetical protein
MLKSVSIITVLIFVLATSLCYGADGFEYAPDPNTLALWHLNEGSGDELNDESPNKFTGVVEGNPDWDEEGWKMDETPGSSFAFDGATVINVGPQENLIFPEAITVEAWVFPISLDGWKLICCHWGGAVVGSWHLGVESGTAKFHINTSNGTAFAGTQQLTLEEWQHVAGTYDGKVIKLYINGEEIAATNHGGDFEPGDPNHDVIIGSKASREFQWNGLLDEVRISSVARKPVELSPNLTAPQAVEFSMNNLPTLWGGVKARY